MADRQTSSFAAWLQSAQGGDRPAIPAATVVVVRDGDDGIETLLMKRSGNVSFAGGMWVFPGGRVDDADEVAAPGDELGAFRAAAVREAAEEADLALHESDLVRLSFWVPPAEAPKRYATWFFLASVPQGEAGAVTVDGHEIHDHVWSRPADALARRDAGDIELAPPTWVTLHWLGRRETVAAALADAAAAVPERFETHMAMDGDDVVVMWHGDAGYDSRDPSAAGPRHRIVMTDGRWDFERTV